MKLKDSFTTNNKTPVSSSKIGRSYNKNAEKMVIQIRSTAFWWTEKNRREMSVEISLVETGSNCILADLVPFNQL